MKVTLNWVKEFLNTDKLDPAEVADLLTMSGTKVEKVEYFGQGFENIVIGQIKSFIRHSNADKLSLCKVDSGKGELSIVCGADNFKQGDKIALAMEGACLGEKKIKKTKIRGEYSEGMMCSEAELGLSSEAKRIMVLDKDLSVGEDFVTATGLDDVVFDIEITPNRPDCFSIIGIAREISAVTGLRLQIPEFDIKDRVNSDKKLSIKIEDYNLCSRYSAKIFKDIPKEDSPVWVKNRLILCGIRPIDLIVDLTNYVMLETGQPLHAFDKDLLHSDKIVVRNAIKGEKIRTIDDVLRELDEDALLIADDEKGIALAGVMGGKKTEINENTCNVLLESANFFGPLIMNNSLKTGLRSEASNRFEKKIDPELTVFALERFECLLNKITGYGGDSVIYDNNSGTDRQRNLILRAKKVKNVVGQAIGINEISKILSALSIENKINGEKLEVNIPSFRYEDLEREIDLVEEITRLYGYNNILSRPTMISSGSRGRYSKKQANIRRIRNMLADAGLNEVINYSFISMEEFKVAKLDQEEDYSKYISIVNPINKEFSLMRTSLLPSMLGTVRKNINRNIKDIAIFEISKVYLDSEKELPDEPLKLAILLTGKVMIGNWLEKERDSDFFDIKGILEGLSNKFYDDPDIVVQEKEYNFFHPRISADILIGVNKTGIAGEIHPNVIDVLGIGQEVFYAEIDLDVFNSNIKGLKTYNKISSFPSVDIDLAIMVDKKIKNKDIIRSIKNSGSNILQSVRLFDLFEGDQIEKGKKSMAYSLSFREKNRTLEDKEVEIIVNRIIEDLEKGFNASLRS